MTVKLLILLLIVGLFLGGCTKAIPNSDQKVIPSNKQSMEPVEEKLIKVAEQGFNEIKSINPNGIFESKLQICSDKNNNKLYRLSVNGGFSGSDTYFDGSGKEFRTDYWDDTYDPSIPEVDRTAQYVCEGAILYSNSN